MAYEDTGLGGTSGLSSLVASHDESLVSILREKKKVGRDINLVTPLAGKGYCFSRWKKSLAKLPMERCHTLVYDNSNNVRFSSKVDQFCKSELDSYTLVSDTNSRCSLEQSRDWVRVGNRCRAIWWTIADRCA